MDVNDSDLGAARVAAAIGEPARARMLYALMDGRARTSTELAALADVTASTASIHLKRLAETNLVKSVPQGKHRYFTLFGGDVAKALEVLNVLGGGGKAFATNTPEGLRAARTCYDHIAGSLGVALHDRFLSLSWLSGDSDYAVTATGAKSLERLGVDVAAAAGTRRRFAYACLDWSERRPHLAGSLGAAVLELALRRRWVQREPEGRALRVTRSGRLELRRRLGLSPD